ncbi:unnamed protein product [Oppiella nova]|uniref:Smr domain-containing protein n=1 Tax=Oppiella nova TaxID=334625 RepID=A0A7R9LWG9_9ACAR|nr:unnamed protein product [Oppiella nova]CAG2166937.1 unnamed protein product [Oppiella nova]
MNCIQNVIPLQQLQVPTKGYKIYFLEPDTHWNRNPKELSKRNIHGIPKEKLELMAQKFERLSVEDVVKGLPSSQSLQKSNSDEKVNKAANVSTNAVKQVILRSSSSPSNAFAKESTKECSDYEESPQSCAQLSDMTSTSSPNSTEPTSPVTENQIDIDLLLALNQRNTDSEDCSSINASEGGSSCGQESGWERDDEFTYTHNQQITAGPSGTQRTDSPVNESDFKLESESTAQSERKHKNAVKSHSDCIEEESAEDMSFGEPMDASNQINCGASSSHQELNGSANNKRMFSLVGVPKSQSTSNWEFPPFPIDHNKMTDNGSEISVTYYSRSSQTELKDWALLELKQCNKDSNEGLETEDMDGEEHPIEAKVDPKKSDLKVRLHKGTITTDMPDDLSRDQKLNTLREKFPKAENNHLNEILDACHEDYKWAEKLLSELNDDHFDVGALEQLSPTGTDRVSSPEVETESSSSTSNSGEEEQLELLVNHQKDSDDPEFVLTLDPLLAAQLQSHFGDITDTLTEDDLTITLSHGVARLLHHTWKKSLHQKPLPQNGAKSQSINNHSNNNHNNKVSNHMKKAFVFGASAPKSELQEIMDLEMAKEMSRKEYDNSLTAEALNSTCDVTRKQAKDLYCLGKTIDVLDNSLGLSDDFSKETEVLIAQERNRSQNGSPMNDSRAASPVKSVRKVAVDINANISQINDLVVKKREFHDKARLAFGRKMFAVASYYGGEAMKLQTQIDRLGAQTVDAILSNSTNSNELDLHGLHIPEVNSILSEYMSRKSEELRRSVGRRKLSVDIITGYGATKGVLGRIKPTVIQYLKQKNLNYEMVNQGVIRVTLTQ